MATVNFSVPDEVKKEFNKTFKGQNKSAILTRLMQQAIQEHKRQQRRAKAIRSILRMRDNQRPVTDKQITVARRAGRT